MPKPPTIAIALALAAPRLLAQQCPDGSPPPCPPPVARAVAPQAGSIAVLYFQARDTANAYLADGLTEDVTTLLARQPGLAVKPSSSVRLAQRRNPDAGAPTLGRTLAVRYVVLASLRRAADHVRLNVQLVDAGSDVTVWGESYDRTAEALLDLPGELARVIAERVAPTIVTGRAVPPPRAITLWKTTNPAALDHFRRGNFLLATRVHFPEAFAQYQEAARADPLFAAAVARAAYTLAVDHDWDGPDSLVPRGFNLANAALHLDSLSSDAWMALGYLRYEATPQDLVGAELAFQRAVALDPVNAEAWHQYGDVLHDLGDSAGAVRVVERALAIEPARAVSLFDLARYVGRGPRALALIDSAIAINPAPLRSYGFRATVLLGLGRPAEALQDAERVADSLPVIRVKAYLALGDSARARQVAAPWLAPHADGGRVGAEVALALSDAAWALEHLERIPSRNRKAGLWVVLRGPEFDPLRGSPRFQRVYQDARPVGARMP